MTIREEDDLSFPELTEERSAEEERGVGGESRPSKWCFKSNKSLITLLLKPQQSVIVRLKEEKRTGISAAAAGLLSRSIVNP